MLSSDPSVLLFQPPSQSSPGGWQRGAEAHPGAQGACLAPDLGASRDPPRPCAVPLLKPLQVPFAALLLEGVNSQAPQN